MGKRRSYHSPDLTDELSFTASPRQPVLAREKLSRTFVVSCRQLMDKPEPARAPITLNAEDMAAVREGLESLRQGQAIELSESVRRAKSRTRAWIKAEKSDLSA